MKDVDLAVLETIVAKMRELGIRKLAVGDIEVELNAAPMGTDHQLRRDSELAALRMVDSLSSRSSFAESAKPNA